jgi:hypothetical protein
MVTQKALVIKRKGSHASLRADEKPQGYGDSALRYTVRHTGGRRNVADCWVIGVCVCGI